MAIIEIGGSLYGAGPNIRPGCVASISRDEIFRYDGGGDVEDIRKALISWLAQPVQEGTTVYPHRYLKGAILQINGGRKIKTVIDVSPVPAMMDEIMSKILRTIGEVAP